MNWVRATLFGTGGTIQVVYLNLSNATKMVPDLGGRYTEVHYGAGPQVTVSETPAKLIESAV